MPILTEKELLLKKTDPKKYYKLGNTKMICEKCENVVSINATGLCKPCRTKTCACGNKTSFYKHTNEKCGKCIAKAKQKKSSENIFGYW